MMEKNRTRVISMDQGTYWTLNTVLGAHWETGTFSPNSCYSEECNAGCLGMETKISKGHLTAGDTYLQRERQRGRGWDSLQVFGKPLCTRQKEDVFCGFSPSAEWGEATGQNTLVGHRQLPTMRTSDNTGCPRCQRGCRIRAVKGIKEGIPTEVEAEGFHFPLWRSTDPPNRKTTPRYIECPALFAQEESTVTWDCKVTFIVK